MASETVTLTAICSGGNHLTFSLTGALAQTVRTDFSTVLEPMTEAELEAFCKALVKLGKIGRTNAQLRTLFQNGVTVTV
jgi:hypothetical protein